MHATQTLDLAKLAEHHIPLADNRAHFIIALEGPDSGDDRFQSEIPTDAELALLRAYQLFEACEPGRSLYNDGYKARFTAAQYPGDDGHNTTIFSKCHGGWRHRAFTWYLGNGPYMWPPFMGEHAQQLTLMQLLDHLERDIHFDRETDESSYVPGRKWEAYKSKLALEES